MQENRQGSAAAEAVPPLLALPMLTTINAATPALDLQCTSPAPATPTTSSPSPPASVAVSTTCHPCISPAASSCDTTGGAPSAVVDSTAQEQEQQQQLQYHTHESPAGLLSGDVLQADQALAPPPVHTTVTETPAASAGAHTPADQAAAPDAESPGMCMDNLPAWVLVAVFGSLSVIAFRLWCGRQS